MKQLTFIDLFAGIGGMRLGHEWASMKCVGFCEFDKFAVKSYRAIHDTEGEWYGEDITKVRGAEVPHADVWRFGFPCQDISVAGKQRGLDGERSGLFYEVMRLIGEKGDDKPEWLIIENVRNLLSIDTGRGFVEVLNQMAAHGYDARWETLNSKDFGVPQDRKRAFIVGRLRKRSGREVLSQSKNGGLSHSKNDANKGRPQAAVCSTIDTGVANRADGTFIARKINQVGQLYESEYFGGNPQRGRVYGDGLSPTLASMQGGGLEPKVICSVRPVLTPDRVNKRQNGRRFKEDGEPMFTLTTQDRHGVAIIDGVEVVIRRLTPRECWRLQGMDDARFNKAQAAGLSDRQLYKQAGNAVTVTVAKAIGEAVMSEADNNEDY
ncbi:MAG: DNA (cytosine-5-)-methyltransferase [Negativicoccus succinicivorans]|uniref:DNA cytosine methyltransferase n=1 Tax=Negativicoccus succinicivorans TaxID=620903 RepID=UPI00290F8E88|nr:DNA (cytosine-5-)-methyltransferase [Negativicoccus succinicivorans]MDU5942758.1 DNA (cytosine-5-)-methyltransferase [Negativicoccus succinicivorans]